MKEAARIRLLAMGSELGVAVEDVDGVHQGILVPEGLRPALERLLPLSGERFLQFWHSYSETRGGDTFFEDLKRFADAITSTPEVSDLVFRLAKEGDADQWFHNAYQAQLAAAAYRRFGNVTPDRKSIGRIADLLVTRSGSEVRYEVKAFLVVSTLQLLDEGVRIAEESLRRAQRSILDKVLDAEGQVGKSGSVVLPIWCNHLGQALVANSIERSVSLADAIEPASVVLGCRTAEGTDAWLRFSRDSWLGDFNALIEATCDQPQLASIQISGGTFGFTNSTEWTSLGRTFTLDNRVPAYGRDEKYELDISRMLAIPNDQLLVALKMAQAGRLLQEKTEALLVGRPLERGTYTGEQLLSDDRWQSLFEWARGVAEPIALLLQSGLLPPSSRTRIGEDLRSLARAFQVIPDARRLDQRGLTTLAVLLKTPYSVSRLARLTVLAVELLSGEVQRRSLSR